MIKVGTGVLVLFFLATLIVDAQVRRVIRTKEILRHGDITFNDNTTLTCDFFYNPLTEEGILFVVQDSITVPCGVTKVRNFSFFDDEINQRRDIFIAYL
jgi:hypothetical protein